LPLPQATHARTQTAHTVRDGAAPLSRYNKHIYACDTVFCIHKIQNGERPIKELKSTLKSAFGSRFENENGRAEGSKEKNLFTSVS
jgi:hypothetical protein